MFRERLAAGTSRAADFQAFAERERWWLDDYALFRALHDEHHACYWRDWKPELRDRDPLALDRARQRLADTILYYRYLQWLADTQWRRARRDCGRVGIFGDFPFMVSGHSADVWSRQHQFRIDASVGVPPDAFSETGQDWGLPVYRWDAIRQDDYEWLRQRARRCTDLYDGFRVDHLVGFYRTYVRERDGRTYFTPADEPSQTAQGERVLAILRERGARIIAEDLGVVPDFVRESLARVRVPGLKVLRWEREWHRPGQPFRRPADYPAESVAISGTHDTDTLAEWWDGADRRERQLCAEVPGLREAGCDPDAPFDARLRDALLRGAVLCRIRHRHCPVPGSVRLARSRQRAGSRQRRELDVAAALADRRSGHPARSARARRISQRAGAGVRAGVITPGIVRCHAPAAASTTRRRRDDATEERGPDGPQSRRTRRNTKKHKEEPRSLRRTYPLAAPRFAVPEGGPRDRKQRIVCVACDPPGPSSCNAGPAGRRAANGQSGHTWPGAFVLFVSFVAFVNVASSRRRLVVIPPKAA